MNQRIMQKLLVAGGVLGLTSVMMGAYIDHGLAASLSTKELLSMTTAVRYQQFYALVITLLAIIKPNANRFLACANISFLVGLLLFSVSIYVGIIFNMHDVMRAAPLGGFILMLGWVCLIGAGCRQSKD